MDQTINEGLPTFSMEIIEASKLIRNAKRILVVGCSGGGKSTLAQRLARSGKLTYISIDRDVLWLTGWIERGKGEQREIIARRILEDRWIMDGTNPSTFDLRLPRTDVVIWVRMPRLLCIWGVTSRWMKWIGRTRPEMAPGCIEKIDWQFLKFIWTFERKFSPRIIDGLAKYGDGIPVLQLKSRGDIRKLLDILDPAD